MQTTPVSIAETRETYIREDGTTFTRSDIFVKLAVTFRDTMLAKLKGPPLSVFLCVALHCNQEMEAWPSIATIARETGYSKQAVIEATRTLTEELHLLERETRKTDSGDPDSNLYRVVGFISMGDKGVVNVVDNGLSTTLTGVVNQVDTKKIPIKKNQQEPGPTSALDEFFGPQEPMGDITPLGSSVNLLDEGAREAYLASLLQQRAARAEGEPWRRLFDWISHPRQGIERDTLRRVAWTFTQAGIPEPQSDKARSEWRTALPDVYKESAGDFGIIKTAAQEIVKAGLSYWPPHRWHQQIVALKAQTLNQPTTTGGWQIPG